MVERLRGYAVAAGRDSAAIGIEARLSLAQVPESGWQAHVEGWRNLGATHLGINTMGMGNRSVDDHIAALRRAREEVQL